MTLNYHQKALISWAEQNMETAIHILESNQRDLDANQCMEAFALANKAFRQIAEIIEIFAARQAGEQK